MITLFWCPRTRASRILWLLGELDQPFEVRKIDIRKPEAKADPDFVASSPMGKAINAPASPSESQCMPPPWKVVTAPIIDPTETMVTNLSQPRDPSTSASVMMIMRL